MNKSEQINLINQSWEDKRWDSIERPYTAEDVYNLRGSQHIEHSLARLGAERLWKLLHEERFLRTLGALTGNQAVQQVQAGLKAIYLSGWQVAADANNAGQTYPDQSLYPADSVPSVVKRINNATPDVGSTVVFTIDVVNNGPSDATTVVVNDILPNGYAFVSDDAAGAYNATSGVWTVGNLTTGANRTLNITATVNATGNYLNRATATSTETDGNLQLSINGRNAPELKVSNAYKSMLKTYADGAATSKSDKEAVSFVKQKLDSAKWFIDAIKQRQNTLLLTMDAIMKYQKTYFEIKILYENTVVKNFSVNVLI